MSWNCAKPEDPPKYVERIKLSAVPHSESLEDQSFSSATPTGELEITVTNPAIVGTFEQGSKYYLFLDPCPPEAQ